jgi:hypothetical protein
MSLLSLAFANDSFKNAESEMSMIAQNSLEQQADSSSSSAAAEEEILTELRNTVNVRLAYLNEFEDQMSQMLNRKTDDSSAHSQQKRFGVSSVWKINKPKRLQKQEKRAGISNTRGRNTKQIMKTVKLAASH